MGGRGVWVITRAYGGSIGMARVRIARRHAGVWRRIGRSSIGGPCGDYFVCGGTRYTARRCRVSSYCAVS